MGHRYYHSIKYIEISSIAMNQFTGSVPVSISNASNLDQLQLSKNKLSGKVPSFEKLNRISFFSISSNNLGNGWADDLNFFCSLMNATYLTLLTINSNNFGGELSECIGNLSTLLTKLSLYDNKISGKISTQIGNLINMERLEMWNNKISGNIPLKLESLKSYNFWIYLPIIS